MHKFIRRSLIAAALLVSNSAFAADAPLAATNVDGPWVLTYCWGGIACGTTLWNINQIGALMLTNDPGVGSGVNAVGLTFNSVFLNKYIVGCRPLYQAYNLTPSSASGIMACEDPTENSGTWSIARAVPGTSIQSRQRGLSAAGQ